MGEDDCAAEFGEELGRDCAGGAVGAVDDDAMAVERKVGDGSEQRADVLDAIGLVYGRRKKCRSTVPSAALRDDDSMRRKISASMASSVASGNL